MREINYFNSDTFTYLNNHSHCITVRYVVDYSNDFVVNKTGIPGFCWIKRSGLLPNNADDCSDDGRAKLSELMNHHSLPSLSSVAVGSDWSHNFSGWSREPDSFKAPYDHILVIG